jgi:hypothetical protein
MMHSPLQQRAVLAVWPSVQPSGATEGREFPTLREAIEAAVTVLDGSDGRPWIVIEDGTILQPGWIREKARALGYLA